MHLNGENLDYLAALTYLDKVGMALFFKLVADCDNDSNRVKVDYDDLIDFFSNFTKPGVIKRHTLVRRLKNLRRNGILSIVPGKRNDFLLNPTIIHHGIASRVHNCDFYYEYADGLMLTGELIDPRLDDKTAKDKQCVESHRMEI
jgi:hypothetical protein